MQEFKDAAYGKGFTADIDGKKPAPKRKAPEMADEEKAYVGEVYNSLCQYLPPCCTCVSILCLMLTLL